ncbi:YciI family protein [Actinomycetospora endophytica]|uniref:YciI family protein n=1 Tax=Actinomycetospora endophytica TaxID=2291215 RepID=A0ABS8PEI4_9PSEU|nr:YciI family protein [Actinomycetospora endophytica]MCD2196682.1 YciI family protein [Actinomycetospora endophytica]
MAGYLILLYVDEAAYAADKPDDLMDAHLKFQAAHGDALRGGAQLAPSATATAVRGAGTTPDYAAGTDAEVTDGPYVETKEALGGYYLIDVPDLDAALAVARDVPAAFGGIEVRPLIPMS